MAQACQSWQQWIPGEKSATWQHNCVCVRSYDLLGKGGKTEIVNVLVHATFLWLGWLCWIDYHYHYCYYYYHYHHRRLIVMVIIIIIITITIIILTFSWPPWKTLGNQLFQQSADKWAIMNNHGDLQQLCIFLKVLVKKCEKLSKNTMSMWEALQERCSCEETQSTKPLRRTGSPLRCSYSQQIWGLLRTWERVSMRLHGSPCVSMGIRFTLHIINLAVGVHQGLGISMDFEVN